MMRFRLELLLALSLGLVSASCQPKDTPQPHDTRAAAPGLVLGVVADPISESPVAGVRVRAHDLGETLTDAQGRFSLTLPPGEHRLWLDRDGFIDGQLAHVRVRAGETTRVEAGLYSTTPDEDAVHRYFQRQPPRRDAHPAYERPESAVAEPPSGEVGAARAAIHEPPVLPAVIRVWRSSRAGALAPSASNGWADNSCDPAVEVDTLPLEEYVKGVIPREWIPSWHPEALRAGAIVARTFGAKWALRGGRWDCADLDDGTVTQVYRDERAATTNDAVDATAGQVVMRGEVVISTEYSAENSDPTSTGVDDPTCTGTTRFGHGRGMCQWGTQRWAKGICANPPCEFGVFGPEPKLHIWMVEHYYPGASVVAGSSEPVPPCKLIPPEGDILDDAGPCFDAFGDPMYWRTESVGWGGGLLWTNAFEAAVPGNWARWQMFFEAPGEYAVDVYVEPTFGVHKTTRYSVTYAGGEEEVILDQSVADGWTRLGVWSFDARGEVRVFDNEAGPVLADQHIVADAIRIQPKGLSSTDGGADAGDLDAGAVDLDAGAVDLDASAAPDASRDTGLRVGGSVSGGCSCHVAAPVRAPHAPWLLLLGPLALLWRRSQRSRS